MARALLDSKLTGRRNGRPEFAVATGADDAEIRRLLRENPTPGQISLSLEREPDYFSDAHLPGEEKQTIIAREHGRIACMGSCVVRRRFVNGQSQRVGYLGGLRLDSAYAGRFDIVRRGYEAFRELQADAPADFYFTSIAADNERALRFLERGLPGMPQYELLGQFVTVLIRAAHRASADLDKECVPQIGDKVVAHLNEHNRLYQLSPTWSVDELGALEMLGLQPQDFLCVQHEGRIVASAALWDQRVYRQTVVRDYSPLLGSARPALNLAARILGRPRLPGIDTILANAFVSHLVAGEDQPTALLQLIVGLRKLAAQRGIVLLTLGFAANDPRLATVRSKFRCREYLTRLYIVRWPEIGNPACQLDARVFAPEVALM
jgi:hypothetical protein